MKVKSTEGRGMVTNFDYLKNESKFSAFADVAISAERVILIDPEACILNCRRAMEFAVKWMYSVDVELEMPYQDNLQSLMNVGEYRQIVGSDIWKRMDYIRRCGNNVAHSNRKLGKDEAMLCLENLYIFLDYVAYCYAKEYEERDFNPTLITLRAKKAKESKEAADAIKEELVKEQEKTAQQGLDLQKLLKENASLKEELSARRQEQQQTYTPKPLDLSEYDTRKLYIDAMLTDAGWTEGKDWINEVPLSGMANKSGTGYADYVLYDDMHRPLAIIEAKRTCADVAVGRQQAKLYADIIEKECGRRPVIFLTNGFETHIIDGQYPERKCSFIYSKRDLEKWFNLLAMRTSLKNVTVDKNIAGRYYQEAAIKAVCSSLDEKNRRKALLVMATGSGKTRTVIALCKILLDAGWVKNILFLADRNSLVTQAKRSFVNLLPSLSCTNLVEEKDNYNAHCVFSTYQTMINCIDVVNDKEGKLFTCGHFDLVICDEAHRSIYNKYKDIFHYFDAPLIGLTATPKSEIDKNTYEVFELEDGVPTYGYDLAQAVKDEYLVDYISIESKLKFIDQGIVYDELSEEEKEEYERTFVDEEGKIPEVISSSELNTWIFNEDTIRQALNILMTEGIKIEYGQKLGKTIIFAKNHNHAHVLKPKAGLEVDYLCYSLMFYDVGGMVNGATRQKLTQAAMRQMIIPKRSLDEQIEIVNIIKKVQGVIASRKEELEQLDLLIKARFVEMFYEKGYPVLKWNDVFITTTGKLDSNASVEKGAYPFFTCSKELLRIDTYAFDQEALLLAGNNAAGKYDVKYYAGKFNAYQRTYVLSLKENWSYRLFQYQLEDKLEYLQQQSLGGLTKYLTLKILGELEFVIPPEELQSEFEIFVTQVTKSKVAVQKALDETQILFDSLMQEYFG